MDGRAFKRSAERTLRSLGFQWIGHSCRRHDSDAFTLVDLQKGFGAQWFINVGFWLDRLDGDCPDRVEKTHLYFRLERLVPEYFETIRLAGALDEPDQPRACEELLRLAGVIDAVLRAMGTEAGLRKAMAEGRLEQGLVWKHAREWLVGEPKEAAR